MWSTVAETIYLVNLCVRSEHNEIPDVAVQTHLNKMNGWPWGLRIDWLWTWVTQNRMWVVLSVAKLFYITDIKSSADNTTKGLQLYAENLINIKGLSHHSMSVKKQHFITQIRQDAILPCVQEKKISSLDKENILLPCFFFSTVKLTSSQWCLFVYLIYHIAYIFLYM